MQSRNLIDALAAAPSNRLFITSWVDEDERESLTFGGFRHRAGSQAATLREHGVNSGDSVVILMPQGIPAMIAFAAAMMLARRRPRR